MQQLSMPEHRHIDEAAPLIGKAAASFAASLSR